MKTLHNNYLAFLKQNADKEHATRVKEYLYSDLKHYGVGTSLRRKFYREIQKDLEKLPKREVLSYVKYFWKQPSFEERDLGLHILNIHKYKLTIKNMPLIEKMMRESKGWAFLDNLIIPIMPAILSKDHSAYAYLKKWITDDDFWARRSALLAQVLFFRKGKGGNRKLFFDMAVSQFDESWMDNKYEKYEKKRARFFIRKAIGWAIREISHKDQVAAFEFLKKYRNQMSGLSFSDGSRKLRPSLRNKL